ncbi:MurR/RpiR family transcriptional regulator [Enterococcus sp. DIV0086]|uniref:MurR/RpiR family transcriptional regulator n=1 Tax=Enterococcus sp. DIV0086 TaxID=2774655 RepID=UPI003D2D4B34
MNNYAFMLNYLNTHASDDSYSKIILFLIKNRKTATHISIQEVADACFVSNATISRFSKYFGFDNFSSLKKYIYDHSDIVPRLTFRIQNKSFSRLEKQPKKFLEEYKTIIEKSLDDVIDCLDMTTTDNFLEDIHSFENVYIFSSDNSFNLTQELQRGLFVSGKLVVSGQSEDDMERIVKELDAESLVIIISSFGNFLSEYPKIVNRIIKSKCNSCFLTQHTENMISSSFSRVISVTSHNHVEAGSYPLAFYCEFLVRRYFSLFGM